MTPTFMPGLELSRHFYLEAVEPLLRSQFPELVYSAARIGSGSEVLGFDTARSADHEWGPRLELFVAAVDLPRVQRPIEQLLALHLPKQFLGWSTHFGPEDSAVRRMEPTTGPVRHRVGVSSLRTWCRDRLGFEPQDGVTTFDWLATSGQRLAEVVGGAVFHDGLQEVEPLREQLSWYPPDVWRFILASQWQRIAQEEAFPGRCAETGDELGSRLVCARLVRDLMRLSLLMERRYVPYGKWLGRSFMTLPTAAELRAPMEEVLSSASWPQRETTMSLVYELVAARHNERQLTQPLDVSTREYHERPFQVIDGGRFAAALCAGISDPETARLPLVGNVDQFIDSTDVLCGPVRARAAAVSDLAAQ